MTKPPTVSLLIETASAYGRGLLRGIAHYARLHGPWSLEVEPGGLEDPGPMLRKGKVQGIIALMRTPRLAERILAVRIPTVDLDHALPGLFPWPVVNDELKVGRLAADHLMSCGLRRFAFCGWTQPGRRNGFWWECRRLEGFTETIEKAGYEVDCHAPVRSTSGGIPVPEQKRLARWLSRLPKPVGLLAANDQRGRHVLEAARLAGVRVPDELAVIGVDNDEVLCEMSTPSLSSVDLDARRVGFEGAAALDRLMRGKPAPKRPVVIEPLGVIARRSTDVLAIEDDLVVAALRFIRAHNQKPIRVKDVLDTVSVSRKTLEIKFLRFLGRTPYSEIQRVRLLNVVDLLTRTDWPLKKISAATGFACVQHLHSAFRRLAGMTPTKYRARNSGL